MSAGEEQAGEGRWECMAGAGWVVYPSGQKVTALGVQTQQACVTVA